MSVGIISASVMWHWNLTQPAPACTAASMSWIAFSKAPSWLMPTSAITSGGRSSPSS
jgi:hypothetical protein